MLSLLASTTVQREVSFTKNGRELGVAYTLPPGLDGPFFPAVVLKNAQASTSGAPLAFSPEGCGGRGGRFGC